MKTSRRLLICLALSHMLTLNSFSQTHKYIPFPDSNYIWVVEYFNGFGDMDFGYQRVLTGKIEINNQVYTILDDMSDSNLTPSPIFYYGIRNDTSTRKVFIYDKQSGKEKLLYDFSLKIGDTIPKDFNSRYIGSIITDIDSIDIAGNTHLVYFVDNNTDKFPYIEGIGSIGGPIEKNYSFEGRYRLRCTMIRSTLSSYYTIPGVPCKLFHYTDVTELMPFKEGIEVFPNPVNETSVIKLAGSADVIKNLIIFDLTGKTIIEVHAINNDTYPFENQIFNKGLYFYRIESRNGKVYTGRMIRL